MPKTSTTTPGVGPALKRNQACRQCRKRKLKCDAVKPHCSTCVKHWTTQISVAPPIGFDHPKEPLCTYDIGDGLIVVESANGFALSEMEKVETAAERIKHLESQLAEVRAQLQEARAGPSRSRSPQGSPFHHSPSNSNSSNDGLLRPPSPNPFQLRPVSSYTVSVASAPLQPNSIVRSQAPDPSSPSFWKDWKDEPTSAFSASLPIGLPEFQQQQPAPNPFMELFLTGWNSALPESSMLNHLVQTYFKCDPCSSHILHRPSFLASLTLLPPSHPSFPHPAILHAICASAWRWTSQGAGNRDLKFAEFHAMKAREYMDRTMASGKNILDSMLACAILSWWFYSEGRWIEVWAHAGFLIRVGIPLGLNFPGTHSKTLRSPYLAPPGSSTELETRRRLWWLALMFDRMVSVGGWTHAIDEKDVGTELPLRSVDYEAQHPMPSNPQSLSAPNFLTRHIPAYTDSFILLAKATILFGRVTDFNTRLNLHTASTPLRAGEDIRMRDDFKFLDRIVSEDFLASLPTGMGLQNCIGLDGVVDTDLFLVHVIPHAASITLHNQYNNFSDSTDPSAIRSLHAAQMILESYYLVTSVSFDIKRLHPFVTICWYLAAMILVQFCRRLIEIGESASEGVIWGQINQLRLAMLEYGTVSPIGARQEKLLQSSLNEILILTSQAQPLKVGVPLYPFSPTSLYDPEYKSSNNPMPIPAPEQFEEKEQLVPQWRPGE